jgi:hypothetical protein
VSVRYSSFIFVCAFISFFATWPCGPYMDALSRPTAMCVMYFSFAVCHQERPRGVQSRCPGHPVAGATPRRGHTAPAQHRGGARRGGSGGLLRGRSCCGGEAPGGA